VANRGVLYVVVGGRELYTGAVIRSATSLRRVMPDVSIAVASDTTIDGPFDQHIAIQETDGFRAKILGMRQTPFEQTVFLDADTFVLADIGDVFELLERYDMALVHAQGRISLALDDVPACFPEFNTGVIAYRSTPLVQSALDDWLLQYGEMLPRRPKTQDQPSLRRVLYRTTDLRIATLTSEFNRRFDVPGCFHGQVRVLHGWPRHGITFERIADALSAGLPDSPMAFAGGRVFDRTGRQVADFLPPLHGVRSALRRFVRRRTGRGTH
jgi:hypothetical protein